MSLIMNEQGNAYCNMTNEAKELYEQYHRLRDHYYFYSYNLGANAEAKFYEEKSHEVLIKMLDICDTRLFCVVTGNEHVRHIFRVEEEAVNRLEELKEEYYETYTKLPDDNFCFFRGLHRAQAYAEKFVNEEVDERE